MFLIIYSAQTKEEGIDDIFPFPCVLTLQLHAGEGFFPVGLRKRETAQRFLHVQHLLVSFEMIIIDSLDERSAVTHFI